MNKIKIHQHLKRKKVKIQKTKQKEGSEQGEGGKVKDSTWKFKIRQDCKIHEISQRTCLKKSKI